MKAGKTSSSLRQEKLCLQCILKLKSNPNNPAYSWVFNADFKTYFQSQPQVIPTLGIRMQSHMSDIGVNFDCIATSHLAFEDRAVGVLSARGWQEKQYSD